MRCASRSISRRARVLAERGAHAARVTRRSTAPSTSGQSSSQGAVMILRWRSSRPASVCFQYRTRSAAPVADVVAELWFARARTIAPVRAA